MSERLPTPEEVFETWFRPWYPDQGNDRSLYGLRTDLEEIELPRGTSISVLQPLEDAAERRAVLAHLDGMLEAAAKDWPHLFGVEGVPGRDWIERFEETVDEDTIREWIHGSPADQLQNTLLILTCEVAMVLAAVLRNERPGLQWLPDIPYWDSALFDLNTKVRVPVFHWAIKRLSSKHADEPLIGKLDATIAFIEDTP